MIYSKLRRTNIQNAAGTPVTPRILHMQEPDKLKIVDSSQFQFGDVLDAKSTMELIGKGGGSGADMKMLQAYVNKMTIEYDPATKSVKLISPDGIVIGSADMSSIATEGGEANQDAYSNIKVGSTTLAATSKTDTVEFAGSSVITVAGSTAADKKVTITHNIPTGAAVKAAGFYKFATDAAGHATGLTAVAASDITALIGAHSLTLSKTNAANDTAAITIGSTSYTVGPIPLGDETNPAEGTLRYILNH